MVIHKCSICGKKHINGIRVLQSYICADCEKNICKLSSTHDIDYSDLIFALRQIWSEFV